MKRLAPKPALLDVESERLFGSSGANLLDTQVSCKYGTSHVGAL
jgi:hypothetical protein